MPPAIPIATYRLQLSADLDFDAAVSVVPYLKALGITHLYASPFMQARKGSAHGYDVTVTLVCTEGHETVAERSWQRSFPRDLA